MKHAYSVLLLLLCANVAWAEPPSPASTTPQKISALVQELLLKPLTKAQSKRRRFSRAAPVAVTRRVRVLATHTDVRGHSFVRFAVDERLDWDEQAAWETDAFVGCVYAEQRKVFVQRGNQYVPAGNVLGQNNRPEPVVCRPAPINNATASST